MSKCGPGTFKLAFDVTNPEAVTWAEERAGVLIKEIKDETLKSVRMIMKRAFTEGLPPRTSARLIREVVGLTSRQTASTLTYRDKLLKKGMKTLRVESLVKRYAEKLRKRRALVIARTETIAASNEGQRQLWLQAVKAGYLTGEEQREWIVTPDDRLCERCAVMDGQTARINEPFRPETGKSVMSPPLHPNCRCATGLVVATAAKRKAA